MNKSIVRKISVLILTMIFSESVIADTTISKNDFMVSNAETVTDSEHTENIIETTTESINGDKVTTPSATEIDNQEEVLEIADTVLSDSALDFELQIEDIPDYVVSIAESNKMYYGLDDSSKFYLNRYIGVREDTMTECEQNGLTVVESIPMSLLMQRLGIDYSHAIDMVIKYGSQTKALDVAKEYREREYDAGFLSQEDIKPELVELLINGYSTYEIINSFAVSQCLETDVKSIITKDKNVVPSHIETIETVVDSITPEIGIFSESLFQSTEKVSISNYDTLELSNEYCVNNEVLVDYMESNAITPEEMKYEIIAEKANLGVANDDELKLLTSLEIETYSSSSDDSQGSSLSNDSAYKEGPFNYNEGVGNVDVGTGMLSYTDNVMSIAGINGLDFNLNIMYTSKDSYGNKIDSRFNVGKNWTFSFPFLMDKDGSDILAKKNNGKIEYAKTPMYLVTASGVKYEIDDRTKTENRRISHCGSDEMHFNNDINSKGGSDSYFELTHLDGTMDYFDNKGRWISTVNRFGNSIKITSDTKTGDNETVVITDALGRTIEITTVKTTNGYEQSIVRPDNTTIKYLYNNITTNNGLQRTILSEKRETIDGSKTLSTKYEYTYGSGHTTSNMGDTAENMLLTKITLPNGLVSHYEYSWFKKYYIRSDVFQNEHQLKARFFWSVNNKFDPKIVKRWVTINGVDKNVEKYDYSAYPYVRPDESIMNIPNSVYDDNGNLINISTANDEMNVSGLNDDKIRYVINALSDNLYQKSNTKVYNMQSSTSNNYKNYVNYFFDEYGKTIETKNFADNVNYLTVTDFYRDVYSPYPSNRTITTESYIIREETSYQAGNLYEKTTKDNNGNVIAYERTDYDYGKFSEGHYGLPIKSQSKISSTQINLVENTLTDKGRSIGETKAYLQTNGNKDLKSKSVYSYNASMPGRVTEEKNYINNSAYVSTAYTYNNTTAKPIISKFTSDGVNYDTTYEYDTLGQLKKVVYPNSLTTNYEYDNIGNITKESSSGGTISTVKTFVYDYTGNTIIVTNENGKKVKYNYDQTGNLISVMDMENGNNVLESYTYDSYLRPITQTSGGAVTTLSYDNRDRVTGKITKGGNNKLAQENYSYAINATGLLTTTTVVGDSNACSYSTSVQQDVLGRTVSETNRQGGVTKYSYDMAGNVIKKVPPTGNGNYSLTYTYDTAGNVLSETETGEDIDTSTKTYTYDMLGRMTTSTDGMGKKTTYTYCGTDWVKTIQTPFSGTSYGQTSYTYDKSGNVTSESVKTSSSSARTTTYTYDLLNRVTESKLNGVSTTYTYDKVGNVLSTTMANGTQTVKYAYDQLNRPVKYTDALGKSETYKYNNYGDMTSKVDRNGVTTNYTYDGLHRLTSEKAVKNGVTSAKYFTYALTGQLVWESNGSLAKSYSYAKDNLGKIYSDESYTLNGLNYRTRRLYNIADMNNYVQTFRSDVSYSIYTLNYSFDSKGRLYMFSSQSASEYSVGSKYDIYYTYDKNDNIKTGKTRGGVTTEYSYNDANMLTSLVNKKGTTTYSTYIYNYNLDGNINRKVESGKITDYIYDGTGRLSNEKITNGSAVTNMTYGYDNAGNRSSLTVTGTENYVTTYSYDKNNRLLKDSKKNNGASYADVTLYSYDNNGNQIRKDQSRDDLTSKSKMGLSLATANSSYGYEKFTYNGFNQLTAFEDEAGNKATYEYYSDGLRLSKTVNGAKSSYIWTDNNLSMEIKSDEVISYAKAPGYMRTGSSKDSLYRNDKLYLFNGHGDVTSMVDKSGKVTKTYSYDAFGNEVNRDKNDTNPFRYCGEYWDNETESIYLRARYYNPSIGRFTTEDTHWNSINLIYGDKEYKKDETKYPDINAILQSSNLYWYCMGNPIKYTDKNGSTSEAEAEKIIKDNAATIIKAGKKFNVNPAIIAGCIYAEQTMNVDAKDKYIDPLVYSYGIDVSIGIGQVRISTAKKVESKGYMPKITVDEFVISNGEESIIDNQENNMRARALMNDGINIMYVAAYLSYIQDIWKNVYPQISGKSDILGTLYNIGEYGNNGVNSNPQSNAFGKTVKINYDKMQELLGLK